MEKDFVIHSTAHFRFLRPTYFGYDVCKPLHTGGLRVLNEWVIHYVFSGTGIFQTRGRLYHPKAGDCFIIRPDELAFYAADQNDPWTYAWFNFHCDVVPPPVMEQDVISDKRLEEVFLSACEQGRLCPEDKQPSFIYGKLFELFGLLEILYPTAGNPSDSLLIHQAILYIEENYCNGISVNNVAEHVHMERTHFITRFQKAVGINPKKYITNLRLYAAAGLLLHKDLNAKQVAERTGYNDPATFSRAFKQQYGLSPQEYVKKYYLYAHRD